MRMGPYIDMVVPKCPQNSSDHINAFLGPDTHQLYKHVYWYFAELSTHAMLLSCISEKKERKKFTSEPACLTEIEVELIRLRLSWRRTTPTSTEIY